MLRGLLRLLLWLGLCLGLLLLGAWGSLAIYYSPLPGFTLRSLLAMLFILATLVVMWRIRTHWHTVLYFLGAFAVVFLGWLSVTPSHDRAWLPEVAVLPEAVFDGSRVTVRNIRNFDYKTERDFTTAYYNKTFDLTQLETLDLFVSYWDGNTAIAHTFLSFGFTGGDYLALSVEIRREQGEKYSPIKGSFKQYEIIYVLGDERDLVRLRTNYRDEEVYLYPMTFGRDTIRQLFVDILQRVNAIAANPAFYYTLGRNCTTSLVSHFNRVTERPVPLHRKLLTNGYSDELAYELGGIASHMPFAVMKPLHRINTVAQSHNDAPDFSQRIRAHLPRQR